MYIHGEFHCIHNCTKCTAVNICFSLALGNEDDVKYCLLIWIIWLYLFQVKRKLKLHIGYRFYYEIT